MDTKIKWLGIIRIIGITLIVVYHYFTDFLPGGFLGVDMFLTLSGFLMTAGALDKIHAKKDFTFPDFMRRRFERILPPLFIMIIIILPSALLISPDFTASISRQAAAALGFVTNYYEIINGGSYEAQMLPHLFMHTWFLSVEMHIYIVWGGCLAVIAWNEKRYNGEGSNACKNFIFALSAVLAAGSYIHMQVLYNGAPDNPSVAYLGSTSRAFPFFIGSMLGALTGLRIPKIPSDRISKRSFFRRPTLYFAIIVASVLIFISFRFDFSSAATYRYGMLFASLLTVALIVLLRQAHKYTPENVKEPAALTFFADTAFGVYLFHWPLNIIILNLSFEPSRGVSAVVALLLSLLLSMIVTNWATPVLISRKRLPARVWIVVFMICLGIVSVVTLLRAPNVSSLEERLYVSRLYQDSVRLQDMSGISVGGGGAIAVPDGGEDGDSSAGTNGDGGAQGDPDGTDPDGGAPENIPAPTIPPWTPSGSTEIPMSEDEIPPGGIFIVGDSVIMGAVRELHDAIPGVKTDGATSWQMWNGYEYLTQLREEGKLSETIVVSLGTNTNVNTIDYTDKIIDELPAGHRLVFVTPYNGNYGEESGTYKTAVYLRTLPEKYDFITIADWSAAVTEYPDAVGADRVHIGGLAAGVDLMVEVVVDALRTAFTSPLK